MSGIDEEDPHLIHQQTNKPRNEVILLADASSIRRERVLTINRMKSIDFSLQHTTCGVGSTGKVYSWWQVDVFRQTMTDVCGIRFNATWGNTSINVRFSKKAKVRDWRCRKTEEKVSSLAATQKI